MVVAVGAISLTIGIVLGLRLTWLLLANREPSWTTLALCFALTSIGVTLCVCASAVVPERRPVSSPRRCDRCGYEMTGLSIFATCPECGHRP